MEKEKISFEAYILAFSIWMLLITWEGGFMIQSILPFLIVLLLHLLVKRKLSIKVNKNSKLLLLLVLYISLATAINALIYTKLISSECIIGILYFFTIFLWFCLLTQKNFNKREINLVLKSYLALSAVCSTLIIINTLKGATGKISFYNFWGILIDENYVSALMSIPIIYLLIYLITSKEPITKKMPKLLLLVYNVFGILLTGSRAAFLGLILTFVLSFAINLFTNINSKKIMKTIGVVCIFLIVAKIALSFIPEWTYNRFINGNYHDNSNSERVSLWKNAFKGISKSPIFGYGMGFFHNIEEYQYAVSYRKIPKAVPAHNTFLDITIYSGIVGLIIFLYLLWNIFKPYLKKENRMGLPIVAYILFISVIVGAEKTVFFWNNLILLVIIEMYIKKNQCSFSEIFLKEGSYESNKKDSDKIKSN